METVFIILLAFFGYNVESMKIRATRIRTIQYLPFKHNLNTQTQTQYFNGLSQNQNAPIFKNSRLTYSPVNPGGVRYNMFSGSGAYGAYTKSNLNRGQSYQSVLQNWPSSAVQGIFVDQNRYNSGYTGLTGQSAYQGWQHSASGTPIDITFMQNGINPGHTGNIKQTVYQRWQNLGDVDRRRDIDLSLYQNLQNFANVRPNLAAYVERSGLNSGNIDQSEFQSWDNAANKKSVDISSKPSGVSLLSSAPESLVNFPTPTDQIILNDQSNLKTSGDDGENYVSVDRSVPNSVNGGLIDYSVQQNIPNFGHIDYEVAKSGQQSDNEDQARQGEVNAGHKPQFINEIKVNTDEKTELINSVSQSDSADKSILNQPNEAPLQGIVQSIKENSSPIDTDIQNYRISPYNQGIFSLGQTKLDWPNEALPQNIGKSVQENSPIGMNENDLKSLNNDGVILADQSKLIWPIRAPLQNIMKDGHNINKEENISPIDVENQNYLTSANNGGILSVDQNNFNEAPLQDIVKDNEGINSVDHSKLNWQNETPLQNNEENISRNVDTVKESVDESKLIWANQNPLKGTQFNNEEEISSVSRMSDPISPNNEGKIIVNERELNGAEQTPLQDIFVKNTGNVIAVKDQLKNYLNFAENIGNTGLLAVTNAEEDSDPISILPENYLIPRNDERGSSVDQNKLYKASKVPVKNLLEEMKIKTRYSGPVSQIGKQISLNKFIYRDQSNKELTPIPINLNILKPNQQLVPIPNYSNILRSNQEQSSVPIIFEINEQESPVFKTLLNQVTTAQQQPLKAPYEMSPGNINWNKIRKISPQQGYSAFSSICQNPNTVNVIPKNERVYYGIQPATNTQKIFEYIENLKKIGLPQNPPFILKPKIGIHTNIENSKSILYEKEINPYYTAGILNVNKYNVPQPSYDLPTPTQNNLNVQFENYRKNRNSLQQMNVETNEDKEVTTKASYNTNVNFYKNEDYPLYKINNFNMKKNNIPQRNYYVTASSPVVKNGYNIPAERVLLGKKAIHPYSKLENLNEYNNPQVKYYLPTSPQPVRNKFDNPSVNFYPNTNSLHRFSLQANEEEVITNPPDSRVIFVNPNGVQKRFATKNFVPESRLGSTITKVTEMTGQEKPTTKTEYIYQVTKAFMPELLRLYNSKCENGYDEKLLEEFKKLVVAIEEEHCTK